MTEGAHCPSLHDRELARSAARGDRAVQRELVVRLQPLVRRTIGARVHNANDREDTTQHAMLEILASLGRYRGEGGLEAWAYRIARRVAGKFLTRERRRLAWVTADEPGELAQTGSLDDTRLSSRIAALLTELPQAQRDAIVLHHAFEFSVQELALVTGVSPNTAKSRISFGLRRLRARVG